MVQIIWTDGREQITDIEHAAFLLQLDAHELAWAIEEIGEAETDEALVYPTE